MLMTIMRWLRGWVGFKGFGRCPERFLNLTARRGISLWDAQPIAGGLSGRLSAADYRRIRPTARRAGVRLRITERHGLPFMLRRYRARKGLIVGAVLGIALTVFLSQFVWTIEVRGNETVSRSAMLEALRENGLYPGRFRGSLDVNEVRRKTLLDVEEAGWLSINLSGSSAVAELKEKIKKPEINTRSKPCNIKAKCDGVITRLNVHSGTTMVLKGSGVRRGDLLVSGVSETTQNTVRTVCSEAEIYADVFSKKELFIPKQADYYSVTENKAVRKRLRFFNFSLPLTFSPQTFSSTAYTTDSLCLTLNDTELPLGTLNETAYELEERKVTLSAAQAKAAAQNELALYECFCKGQSRIKDKTLSLTPCKDGWKCRADYTFNENIAVKVDFEVKEE